jgi:hypothetical protein
MISLSDLLTDGRTFRSLDGKGQSGNSRDVRLAGPRQATREKTHSAVLTTRHELPFAPD